MRVSSTNGENCIFVGSELCHEQCDWLVDTGASVCLLHIELYEKILPCDRPPLDDCEVTCLTADGKTCMKVLGSCTVTVSMASRDFNIPVIVAELGDIDAILGMPFFRAWNININPSESKLVSYKHDFEIPTFDRSAQQCYRVIVQESVVLGPNEEHVVLGRLANGKSLDKPFMAEFNSLRSIKWKGILLANAIVTAQNHNIVLTGVQQSPELSVELKAGTSIGVLSPVDSAWVHRVPVSKPREYSDMEICELPEHLRDMAETAAAELSDVQRRQLCGMICENADVFVGADGKLGRTTLAKHRIDLTDNIPVKCRPYRPPLSQMSVIENELEKMQADDIIVTSDSPYASPVVLVSKKDGTPRFCVDYRRLNAKTVKNSWPIPNTNQCLDQLGKGKWFSCLDLASGYWQCEIDEADRYKSAFVTHKGLFEFKVLSFGLCNAPGTFQLLIERMLRGLQPDRCLAYLDDIISFGATWEDAVNNLQMIFDRLRIANLKLKPKKCNLFQKRVVFLGHIVTAEGIHCDPDKVKQVQDWTPPTDVTGVRSWLGLCNYYRKFIKSYANIAAPLTSLTRKGVPFQWSPECQAAFDLLKQKLTEAPILAYPSSDPNDEFILDTDCSDVAMGAVLSQVQSGVERVISYGSKSLAKSQRCYCATYKELLALVTFLKYYRHYVYGVKVRVRTDHNSLKWLMQWTNAEGLVGRWIMDIQHFNLTIEHRAGITHQNADALSRKVAKVKRRRCGRQACADCPAGDGTPINLVNVVRTRSTASTSNCSPGVTSSGTQTDEPQESDEPAVADSLDAASGSDDDNDSTQREPVTVDDHALMETQREPELIEGDTSDNASEEGSNTSVEDEVRVPVARESNWANVWSNEELVQMQHADAAINKVLAWKIEGRACPTKQELLTEGGDVKDICGQWSKLVVKNDLLYRLWTPKYQTTPCHQLLAPKVIKAEIFNQLHRVRAGGHFAVKRSLAKARQRFFWPHCKADMERWCKECDVCAQAKRGPRHIAELGQNPVRSKLELVALDILGELPETINGNKYILVATDVYTKWTHAMAMKDQSAQSVADAFMIEFISYLGAPARVLTDQGRQFESQLFGELCRLLDIEKVRSCPYNPRNNGQVERFNATLQQMLKCYVSDNRDDWDEHLPYLCMAYRATPHESTGCSPNMMVFGIENNMPLDVMVGDPPESACASACPSEYVEWLRQTLHEVHQYADEQLASSAKSRKAYYDLKANPTVYRPGQYCWRWYPPAAQGKLARGWTGPVRIMSCPTVMNCVIRLKPGHVKETRVHVNALKHYMGGVPTAWRDFEQALAEAGDVVLDDDGNVGHMDDGDDLVHNHGDPDDRDVDLVVMEGVHDDPDDLPADLDNDIASPGPVMVADMDDEDDIYDEFSDGSVEFERQRDYGRGHRAHKAPVRYSP